MNHTRPLGSTTKAMQKINEAERKDDMAGMYITLSQQMTQMKELQDRFIELEENHRRLVEELEQKEELLNNSSGQLSDLEKQIEQLKAENAELKDEIERILNERQQLEHDKLYDENVITTLNEEKNQIKEKAEASEKESFKKIEEQNEEIEALKNRIETIEAEKEHLQAKADLEKQHEKYLQQELKRWKGAFLKRALSPADIAALCRIWDELTGSDEKIEDIEGEGNEEENEEEDSSVDLKGHPRLEEFHSFIKEWKSQEEQRRKMAQLTRRLAAMQKEQKAMKEREKKLLEELEKAKLAIGISPTKYHQLELKKSELKRRQNMIETEILEMARHLRTPGVYWQSGVAALPLAMRENITQITIERLVLRKKSAQPEGQNDMSVKNDSETGEIEAEALPPLAWVFTSNVPIFVLIDFFHFDSAHTSPATPLNALQITDGVAHSDYPQHPFYLPSQPLDAQAKMHRTAPSASSSSSATSSSSSSSSSFSTISSFSSQPFYSTLSAVSFDQTFLFRQVVDPYFIHCIASHNVIVEVYAITDQLTGPIQLGGQVGMPQLIGKGSLSLRSLLFGSSDEEEEKEKEKEESEESDKSSSSDDEKSDKESEKDEKSSEGEEEGKDEKEDSDSKKKKERKEKKKREKKEKKEKKKQKKLISQKQFENRMSYRTHRASVIIRSIEEIEREKQLKQMRTLGMFSQNENKKTQSSQSQNSADVALQLSFETFLPLRAAMKQKEWKIVTKSWQMKKEQDDKWRRKIEERRKKKMEKRKKRKERGESCSSSSDFEEDGEEEEEEEELEALRQQRRRRGRANIFDMCPACSRRSRQSEEFVEDELDFAFLEDKAFDKEDQLRQQLLLQQSQQSAQQATGRRDGRDGADEIDGINRAGEENKRGRPDSFLNEKSFDAFRQQSPDRDNTSPSPPTSPSSHQKRDPFNDVHRLGRPATRNESKSTSRSPSRKSQSPKSSSIDGRPPWRP
ncbi:uncharacterized protein MONOS_5887 [Monocercomonoides exilis]|uniref:uncharacterized protein n=1 Tax=Monocercomonoides exilis TaxID=2049356 RepID=UPI00355ABCD7|nr:hypothetical protein MONOS_5887 [Monocercomonoides exilis]|eukprot:MONOS_5887.1-p1 / transcript=MONOS_5887.1 / gene=MONOS_5887 / organism=Monocercomonoides_exilis_PA203 / gene_product=unspecified product / transcript_product=unspecified product / location=Mono_scaffold00177:62990-65902(+) / protein_length=971 / sequence_SO=supercontig / SO=protein_coding / is_pseudo=false